MFISLHIGVYKLDNMCAALDIAKRTYYKYRNTQDKDYYDYLLIREIFEENKRTYGYRRICDGILIKYGVILNHKKVARIMKKYNLKPEYIKRLKPNTSKKRIEENVKPNLLKRQFDIGERNRVWVTDITYLIWKDKRAYLSTILDLYDRRVVAYKISKFNNNQKCLNSLQNLLQRQCRGLIML